MELILFLIGGRLYTWIEIISRGYTHWTMFILGGLCFVVMGLLNEYLFGWETSLIRQSLVSAAIITMLEFITGCIVNLWLGWNVWNYSDQAFNVLGQVCLLYFLIWIPLSAVGIILDDWIRYFAYNLLAPLIPKLKERARPHYNLFKNHNTKKGIKG